MSTFKFSYILENVEISDFESYGDSYDDEKLFVMNIETEHFNNKITFPFTDNREKQELTNLVTKLIEILTNDSKNLLAYAHHENGGITIKLVDNKITFETSYCELSSCLSLVLTDNNKQELINKSVEFLAILDEQKFE